MLKRMIGYCLVTLTGYWLFGTSRVRTLILCFCTSRELSSLHGSLSPLFVEQAVKHTQAAVVKTGHRRFIVDIPFHPRRCGPGQN